MYTSCVKPNTVYTKLVLFWQDFSVFMWYNDSVEIQSNKHGTGRRASRKGRLFVCVSDGRQKLFNGAGMLANADIPIKALERRREMELKIEYVPIDSIKPYSKNAKLHPVEQIEQIKKSIQEFGNCDPIGVWNGDIVEGHGRYEALKQLGYSDVPVIRLDHLTDEQRRAYALVHNKLTMNSPFDDGILSEELENILDIDMEALGFDLLGEDEDETYTKKIDGAEYEPTGRVVDVSECYNTDKYNELVEEIEKANIKDDIKDFLKLAAGRHICFDYQTIAEYYANAPKEIQTLMEKSALVIIDYDSAIKNGFTRLISDVAEIMEDET